VIGAASIIDASRRLAGPLAEVQKALDTIGTEY